MRVHCNYENNGNCYYPKCWKGCPNKITKIPFFRYIMRKLEKRLDKK